MATATWKIPPLSKEGSPLFFSCLLAVLLSFICFGEKVRAQTKDTLDYIEKDTASINELLKSVDEIKDKNPVQAKLDAQKALRLSRELDFKKGLAKAHDRIGVVLQGQGEYPKALQHYLKSEEIYRELGNQKGVIGSKNNIAIIYYFQRELDQAMKYFKECLAASKKLGIQEEMGKIYDNIGVIHRYEGALDSAYENHIKSLDIRSSIEDSSGMAKSLNNIAITFAIRGKFNKAIENWDKAYKLNNTIGNRKEASKNLGNIGKGWADKGENLKEEGNEEEARKAFLNAVKFQKRSLKIAQEHGFKEEKKRAYEHLSREHEILGNPQKALDYHKKYAAIKDTISSQAKEKVIAELQTKYQTEKKERENKLLRKDQKLKEKELQQQRLIIYGAGGAALIAIFVVIIMYRLYTAKKRTSRELEKKNISITRQKEEIQRINTELEKLSIVASETDNSIFIMSPEGEVEWANRGFNKMYGYSLEEYKEKFGSNLGKMSNNEKVRECLEECINKKTSVSYQAVNLSKKGNQFWVQTTITPIFNNEGEIRKLVAIDTEITRLKEAEATIRERNKEITDSINYAKRIQNAILPSGEAFESLFRESFFLLKPQSIVSGDFYWAHELQDEKIAWIAADCTGHGVPGAFMSMIGVQLLNEVIVDKGNRDPGMIFDKMKQSIVGTLHQNDKKDTMKDGMDAVLCILDKKNLILRGAGANNPLYLFREDIANHPPEITYYKDGQKIEDPGRSKTFQNTSHGLEIKGDKQAIGYEEGKEDTFVTFELQLQKGDVLYTFSDGYADQFGGPKGKKFRYQPFKTLLTQVRDQPMTDQKVTLDQQFEDWRGELEQIDDVCLVGIRL